METPKREQNEFEVEAIQLVKGEVSKYKDGEWFITENVAIAIRPLIRLLRKNYWGIFDEELDPILINDNAIMAYLSGHGRR
jgi:hypothetical protein